MIKNKTPWDRLSLAEQAEMMKVAVRNGIYNLHDIRDKYNEFARGGDKNEKEEVNTNNYSVGNLVDAIYQINLKERPLGEPEHHYDFTQSEEWANAHGYYPDARGHRDDRVKKPAHPSHPSRGVWDKDKFVLTDLGMQNPNYTMFGLVDGGQDPQAILTYKGGVVLPEITVTPQGNYFFNPYDNIELHTKAHGGSIHIKHPGRLTALKKRTGKSEAELYRTGGPAVRKMITFARNARKWKHGLGGNLFGDGGSLTPEEQVFENFIVKASEDPMVIIAKENPGYSQTLARIYDNDNFTRSKATRLLEVYDYAGHPKLETLPSGQRRPYTDTPSWYTPWRKTTMYLNPNPKQGFKDLIAELSHPIQAKYGNNNPDIEDINPFYSADDYRGKTRYDFPDKYESETHIDFEPLIADYINKDSLFGQKLHTNAYEGLLGTADTIAHPSFKQVLDSAKAYNKRKQDIDYQYKIPRSTSTKRGGIKTYFGDKFSNE